MKHKKLFRGRLPQRGSREWCLLLKIFRGEEINWNPIQMGWCKVVLTPEGKEIVREIDYYDQWFRTHKDEFVSSFKLRKIVNTSERGMRGMMLHVNFRYDGETNTMVVPVEISSTGCEYKYKRDWFRCPTCTHIETKLRDNWGVVEEGLNRLKWWSTENLLSKCEGGK